MMMKILDDVFCGEESMKIADAELSYHVFLRHKPLLGQFHNGLL